MASKQHRQYGFPSRMMYLRKMAKCQYKILYISSARTFVLRAACHTQNMQNASYAMLDPLLPYTHRPG